MPQHLVSAPRRGGLDLTMLSSKKSASGIEATVCREEAACPLFTDRKSLDLVGRRRVGLSKPDHSPLGHMELEAEK